MIKIAGSTCTRQADLILRMRLYLRAPLSSLKVPHDIFINVNIMTNSQLETPCADELIFHELTWY